MFIKNVLARLCRDNEIYKIVEKHGIPHRIELHYSGHFDPKFEVFCQTCKETLASYKIETFEQLREALNDAEVKIESHLELENIILNFLRKKGWNVN